jgi:peptidylprolyl isomerase
MKLRTILPVSVLSLAALAACNTGSSGSSSSSATPSASITADTTASTMKLAKPGGPSSPVAVNTTPIPAPDDVAAPPADAQKTASGLASKVLTPGTGKDHPGTTDKVKVHYTGWTSDGKMFDSSVARNEPTTFGVTEVIKGWTEGLQLMVKGEKRRFWIPAALAYGANPRPGMPAGQLTFDVELLDIVAPPKAPADVKAPPADATKTASGLAYKILQTGPGTKSPVATDRVTVNYSGWTTDGKLFDSSLTRGAPAHFGVGQVIKGWTEGLQLMHVGDKVRFWIPANLAYGDNPAGGRPAGMLVFEVELLSIP